MNWIIWAFAVVMTSVTYQTSAKIFAGKLPIFVYTTIVSVTMLVMSLVAVAITHRESDFSLMDQPKTMLAVWMGIVSFAIELSYYYLYKNNAPLSLVRMLILAGSAVVLLIFGVVFFKERIGTNQIIGLVLSLAGVIFIIRK